MLKVKVNVQDGMIIFINFKIELKTVNISWDKFKLFYVTNYSKLKEVQSKGLNNIDLKYLDLSNDFQ